MDTYRKRSSYYTNRQDNPYERDSRRANPRHSSPNSVHSQSSVRTGYTPPAQNPYMQAVRSGNNPRIEQVHTGFKSDRDRMRKNTRKGMSIKAKLGIGVGILALAGILTLVYLFRPIEVIVNGKRLTVPVGTKAEQVVKDAHLEDIQPGNLVSVTGSVLKAGEGNLFTLQVSDTTFEGKDALDYKVNANDVLTISNGTNIMEEHTTEIKERMPKLVMDGVAGSVAYISSWGQAEKQEVLTGVLSGQTADGKIIQEGKDCVVSLVTPNPQNGEKLVALTFDDGPSTYTQTYLNILKKYNAKATFFVLGENIGGFPGMLKTILSDGHQIANHTYSHKEMTTLSTEQVQKELMDTFSLISQYAGVNTTVMRPPYGAFDINTWLKSKGSMSASILWTKDSEDWRLPGVSTIVSNSIAGIEPGDIILMHDGGGNRDQDVQALPTIIERLQQQGYKLVTLKELLESDPSIPKEVAGCDMTMPEGSVWPTEISRI